MSAASSEKSPSIFGVYFFAVLIALFGGLLGFFYMTTFEAQAFSSQAAHAAFVESLEEPIASVKPGDAYYIEGAVLPTRSWEAKRAQLAAPGAQSLAFSTGEINAWMSAKFRPGGAAPGGEGEGSILIVPGVPNVAIGDQGVFYLNLPAKISAYGSTNDFIVSARCSVSADGLQFQSVNVSSAKVPLPNLLGAKILEVLSQGYQATEEYKIIADAFARADSIVAEGNSLAVQLR
jgi:hypothetical protein